MMKAIFKREFASYFTSTLGYIFMAVFLAISGAMVAFTCFFSATTSTFNYFFIMLFFFIILIPILTMRLLSEERHARTDQLLLTSPVSLFGIVMGKFLAAFLLFEITFAISFVNFIPVSLFGKLNGAELISNFIGVSCLSSALIALGLFLSSLTESQFVAAISSIASILLLLIMGLFSSSINNDVVRNVVKWFSILDRFQNFRFGLFDFSSILYYISLTVIFLFVTVRVLEKRRWS
jgi:ABC-2 type transport system permease protein